MKKSIKLPVYLLFFFFFQHCNENTPTHPGLEKGVVLDDSRPSLSGCEWGLSVKGEIFIPTYLPKQYQRNNLNVWVEYEKTDSTIACGYGQSSFEKIQLLRIEPRK